MNSQALSAIIATFVSAIGVAITLLAARWQLRTRLMELELKEREIENIGAKLQTEVEAMRQSLMRDVLSRRMQGYAALWRVFIYYERNWIIEEKSLDAAWAKEFLLALNACNAEFGVFFSEDVYKPFFEYRERLIEIQKRAKCGDMLTPEVIQNLRQVSTQGVKGMKSLAGAMKDDLGSYIRVGIQVA